MEIHLGDVGHKVLCVLVTVILAVFLIRAYLAYRNLSER